MKENREYYNKGIAWQQKAQMSFNNEDVQAYTLQERDLGNYCDEILKLWIQMQFKKEKSDHILLLFSLQWILNKISSWKRK